MVLATPAAPTAKLLTELAPEAARELAAIEYASVAVVTLAFRAADVPALAETDASGFLVPPVDGRRIKASTFSFAKWGWVRAARRRAAAPAHVDGPAPRGGHPAGHRRRAGRGVAARSHRRDRCCAATPVDTHVQRWGGGLPQYAVGHLDRVARIRAAVARRDRALALCGATYDGVGIPAVIASGHRAAAEVTGA